MNNSFYDRYWSRESGHLPDFALKWPKLKHYIPRGEGVMIVDFGCGSGKILEEVNKINPTAKLIGLDISQKALDEAERVLPHTEFYRIEDGKRLSLGNNSVDFVFFSEVIEHVYDTENAISEVARVLKPGGKLLLTTPYHGFIKNILLVLFVFDKHFDPTGPHVRFFSKKSLFKLLKGNGFTIEKHGYYGRFYPIPHSIFVLAKKE